jgi:hypothetical protein
MYFNDIDPDMYHEFSGEDEYYEDEQKTHGRDCYTALHDDTPIFDEFDEIITDDAYIECNEESQQEIDEDDCPEITIDEIHIPGPEMMGLALALADEIATTKKPSVDENTDRENWAKAMNMVSLQDSHQQQNKKLRKFEQHVDNICKRGYLFDNQ